MGENSMNNPPTESAEELYENAPCGYITFLADGTIFRLNNTLLHLLGYKEKDEVVKVKKIQDLFRIGGKIYFETHFFPLVKMQGFIKEINFDLLRKDGSYFPALLNVNQISFDDNTSTIYRASVLDITDRKKYEKVLLEGKEKAEEATRAKAEFLSTISHEIRTPLNAIVGIGNLFQKTRLNELQKEYARILQLSSSNLLELVNNLLDLSKLEADKIELEERTFGLNQLLDLLLHSFRVRAREKNIEFYIERPENLPDHLLGDPVKLNQILTNLLGNAIKFTKEGYVKLKIEEIEKGEETVMLRFTVSDTGIGIPRDKLKIIFQEFSQASYDVNLEFGGTGLGLTISQKLLQMHGSELIVTSEEGKGSEFCFELEFKISKEVSPAINEKTNPTTPLAATGAKVLVVDDNFINLFIASQYLQGWGLEHDTAESGEEALKAIKKKDYDIILMDLHMPKMNGYEAAMEIRKYRPEPPPVIIALSASGRGDVNLKMKRAGINAYVPKPFTPAELQDVMLHFLTNTGNLPDSNKEFVEVNTQPRVMDKPTGNNEAPISVGKYLQLANGNADVFKKLINSSLTSIKKLQKDFSTTNFNEKGKKLDELIHKNTMSLHYLETYNLNNLLEEFKESLKQDNDTEVLEQKKILVLKEIEIIIRNLKDLKFQELQ